MSGELGGNPPPQMTRRSGEHCKLLQQGPDQNPGGKWISVPSKHHRMPLVEKFVVN